MPLSEYARNKLMDSLLAGGVFMSLHTDEPGLSGANEVAGQSYSRQIADAFSVAKAGEKTSTSDITFDNMPGVTVTHIGVWDAKAGGNFVWAAPLLNKRTIYEGDTLRLRAGNVVLGLD